MLKVFRQRKLFIRILLFVIVGLVGFMMVVTLVPGFGSVDTSLRDAQGSVARIGKASITADDVNREYRRRVEQMGGDAPGFRQFLMQGIINDLITERVAEYEARRLGLRVSPEELSAQLRRISLFYPGGKFVGEETYRQIVQTQLSMTVPQFENLLRRQVLISRLAQMVTGGVTVSPEEVADLYRQQNEKVKIEYVDFQPAQAASRLQPSEEDLRAYFLANQLRYQEPERRVVRFVAVDTQELARRISLTPEELQDYYRRNINDYRVPERVRLRHILLMKEPLSPPAAETAMAEEKSAPAEDPVRKQAEDILKQLKSGADFAKLAKQSSSDEATRDRGGEIGWVQHGQTVPAVEQVIFSVPAGSEPQLVETSYGYHIVQVMEREPGRVKTLAEVRPEIEGALKQEKVQREAITQARKIADSVRSGKTLDVAAREAGWPIRETQPFAVSDTLPALGQSRDFQEAAFRLPTATAGQPNAAASDPVAVPSGYAVLQLKQVQPAHQSTFEEVRPQVERAYRQERGTELAREAAQQLAQEAKAGGDLRRAARAAGLEVRTSDAVTRGDTVPGLGSVRDIAALAFNLPAGQPSPAVAVGSAWVVFQVTEHQAVDTADIPAEQRASLETALLGQKRGLAWRIFIEDSRKRLQGEGKLETNQAAIERLTQS